MLRLDSVLEKYVHYGLAFSGGVDSSFLLNYLMRNGYHVHAYYVETAFQARFETRDVNRIVAECGAPSTVLNPDILHQTQICSNPPDRCYHCKRFLFGAIFEEMAEDGCTVLLDGTNASDDPARRPGMRALDEMDVRSPLREAGMTKDDIRKASRAMGLWTADKPNFSCWATKVPQGQTITQQALDKAAAREGEL